MININYSLSIINYKLFRIFAPPNQPMMKRIFSLLVLTLLCAVPALAQHNVRFDADPKVGLIEQAHTAAWNKINAVEGYRIQIISLSGTNSRKNAQAAMDEFAENNPDMPVYISYHEPNFRVRVGDYREKIDAARDLTVIKRNYPGAFIVKDQVHYR